MLSVYHYPMQHKITRDVDNSCNRAIACYFSA